MRTQFTPGSNVPFSGYMTSIDNESRLRNQFLANQSAAQSKYIPSSTSDLYNYDIPYEIIKGNEQINSQPIKMLEKPASNISQQQPYPHLFETPTFAPFDANEHRIGTNTFENHTRQQVKNLNRK
jgi:hypothetical protein